MGRPDEPGVSPVERGLPAEWAGRKLADLSDPGRFTLVSITRTGSARLPQGDIVGQEGDILHFMVNNADLDAFEERLGVGDEPRGH